MKLVKIEWYDAHSKDEWHDIPEAYIPLVITSVGYISRGTNQHGLLLKDFVGEGEVLLPNVSKDKQCFGTVHIPRGCIKSITVLDEGLDEEQQE
jgi:hypothetical protein